MSVFSSSTAFSVGLQRAVHQLQDPEPRILVDDVAWSLLTNEEHELVTQRPELFANSLAKAFRRRLVVRQRYAEDALQKAAAEGAIQYVILGAGMDSFAYRQPSWAGRLTIFEVDREEEQSRKRARVQAAGLPAPENLHWVEADFENDDTFERLVNAGFDVSAPTFFACLGVLVYLSRQSIERLLRVPLRIAAPAKIVLSTAASAKSGTEAVLARLASAAKEPWLTPLGPEEVCALLDRLGYTGIQSTDTDAYMARLGCAPLGGQGGGSPSHLFWAGS